MSGPCPEYPAVSSERLDALREIDAVRIRQRDESIAKLKGEKAELLSKLERIAVLSEQGMAQAKVGDVGGCDKTLFDIHNAAVEG